MGLDPDVMNVSWLKPVPIKKIGADAYGRKNR